MRRNQGLAGIGTALRLEFSGPTRFEDAAAAWREVVAAATVTDPLARTGTGLLAFGAFAFDDTSAQTSVLIVPQVIVGRENGLCWVTRVWPTGTTRPAIPLGLHPLGNEYRISLLPGALTPDGYRRAVGEAVGRIAAGDLNKVVLARDLVGRLPAESDLRRAVSELALGYPDCWSYAVDGLVGSSPETLIRADHGEVNARVLAGTVSRGADAASDLEAALQLATSTKDGDEHAFAVQSVLASLRPHTSHLTTSEIPFTVKLPNLWHLATDVEGTLSDGSNSLDLIAAMHPTAAVAGTPTQTALALIRELEPFDRGRYAGPVGWVGADGDGEWAIALRCAQVSPTGDVTAYAGCGIVLDSEPDRELAETRMKFRPVVEAFG
ncbi:isochorismate synthase [Cryobacterium sp. TMT1-21]|uniref:isochorismate synthase n=2 Tax=Microbacteriaceae TaxID=85023 RepID=A0AAQ2HFK8_9MICO|nr:isochorismate synthase [Cryobacterium shii]TFC85814.1 isochorismate synthase [Cryobacterium sp. TmT2-59]TFD16496.1 isochorismate synthase [Cryobacterium sp. TMT1-21]TFD16944.1 isochorismate synthase [Cryobacterium sp. TMT4-10]TFD23620.1 isochorismate synthase [Cryobacterium sp. TMT2-23]TFD37531.1 isochorismate synthase [Cryobacterium sp. TMT2-10]